MLKQIHALIWISLLSVPSSAQFETAAVLGTVRDQTGAPVESASVSLENPATGLSLTAKTSESGEYTFINVPIGRYIVRVEASGMRPARSGEFLLAINTRQRIDFDLKVQAVETSMDVSATVSLLETDSSDRGQVIRTRQIVELPLNGRAYSELVYLAPGITQAPSAMLDRYSSREGSFNANGLRSVFNNFLLDGIDNNYLGTSNQGFSNQATQLPPDAVAEFRVVTNNMSAEYGRSGGATVNAAMRSGTNEFHGTVWEFFRNTNLNAVGFFKPASGEKPQLNRNQFGFAIGGPIVKNRTFFFGDYEGFREVSSSVEFATLPNTALRQGRLGIPVVNVTTGRVYPDGNVPPADFTPFARRVLEELPPVTSETAAANNYQRLRRIEDFRDKGDAKIDHFFGDTVRGFFRYSQSRADIFDPGVIPGLAGGDGNGFTRIPILQAAGGATWSLSPSSILEGRFGFSRSRAGKRPVLAGGPSMQELFGIPGLPTDPEYTGGITYQGLVGFTPLGRQFTNPQYQYPSVWNPKVNYSQIAGRHAMKAGLEYQHVHVEQQDLHPVLGLDAYQGLFSGLALPAPLFRPEQAPIYSYADFLFGARAAYVLASPAVANIRQNLYFAYLQDDWRLPGNLTLNLGLRYEYGSPLYERDNRLSNFDPRTNSMRLAGDGGISERALVNPDRNNFAPRLGLAWSLNPQTVVRTGYGLSYVHWNRVGSNYLTLNPPFAVVATALNDPRVPGSFRPTQFGYPADFVSPAGYDPRQAVVQHMPEDSPSGSVQSWFFSVQRELWSNLLLDVSYVGNTANNLALINDLNQAHPNPPGGLLPSNFRRPNPAFGTIAGLMPWGFSNYNGLQIKVERRASSGLYLLNSFTWSKTIDNSSQPLDGGPMDTGNDVPSVQNIHDLNADRGLSAYHRGIVNVTSVVWDLPVGRGRRFGANFGRAADLIAGGWQITAISSARSGAPVTLVYQPSLAHEVSPLITIFGRNQYRANITGDPLTPEAQRGPQNYLNRATVSVPPAHQPFGNAGRNIVRAPDFWQMDLGLFKNFTLSERARLQFRAEAFNALNRTNFREPDANVSNQSFGQIRSAFDPRQFQFALKLLF